MARSANKPPVIKVTFEVSEISSNLLSNQSFIRGYGHSLTQDDILHPSQIEVIRKTLRRSNRALFAGYRFDVKPDKIRILFARLQNWLTEVQATTSFELTLPSVRQFTAEQKNYQDVQVAPNAHTLTTTTDNVQTLTKLLFLAETLLPSEEVYLLKAREYIEHYGELTPAALDNLKLLGVYLDVSPQNIENLNAKAMGKLETIEDKYDVFMQGLMSYKDKRAIDRAWKVMQRRAELIRLPQQDSEFLRDEYMDRLRKESEDRRNKRSQEALAGMRLSYIKKRAYEQLFNDIFEAFLSSKTTKNSDLPIIWRLLRSDAFLIGLVYFNEYLKASQPEVKALRQSTLEENRKLAFNQARIDAVKDFYEIPLEDANAIEKRILEAT